MFRRACRCASTSTTLKPCRHASTSRNLASEAASSYSSSSLPSTSSADRQWLPTLKPSAAKWSAWMRQSRTPTRPAEPPRQSAEDVPLVQDFLSNMSNKTYMDELRRDKARMERIIDAAVDRDTPFVVHILAQIMSANGKEHTGSITASLTAQGVDSAVAIDDSADKLIAPRTEETNAASFARAWDEFVQSTGEEPTQSELRIVLQTLVRLLGSHDLPPSLIESVLSHLVERFAPPQNFAAQLDHDTESPQARNAPLSRLVLAYALNNRLLDCALPALRSLHVLLKERHCTRASTDLEYALLTVNLAVEELDEAIVPSERLIRTDAIDFLLCELLPILRTNDMRDESTFKPMLTAVDSVLARIDSQDVRARIFDKWDKIGLNWIPSESTLPLLDFLAGHPRRPQPAQDELTPVQVHTLDRLMGQTYRQWSKERPAQVTTWQSHECNEWLDLLTASPASSPLTFSTARKFYKLFRSYSQLGHLREPFVARGRTILNLLRTSVPPLGNAEGHARELLNDYIDSVVQVYSQNSSESTDLELSHWHLSIIAQAYITLRDYTSAVEAYERLLRQRMLPNKGDLRILLRAAAERDIQLFERFVVLTRRVGILYDMDMFRSIVGGCVRRCSEYHPLSAELASVLRIMKDNQVADQQTLETFRRHAQRVMKKRQNLRTLILDRPQVLFENANDQPVRPDRQRFMTYLNPVAKKHDWLVAAKLCRFAIETKLYDGAIAEHALDQLYFARKRPNIDLERLRSTAEETLDAIVASPFDLLYRKKAFALAQDLAEHFNFASVKQQLEQWHQR